MVYGRHVTNFQDSGDNLLTSPFLIYLRTLIDVMTDPYFIQTTQISNVNIVIKLYQLVDAKCSWIVLETSDESL